MSGTVSPEPQASGLKKCCNERDIAWCGAGQEPCAVQGQQADAHAAGQPGRQLQDRHHLHHLPRRR